MYRAIYSSNADDLLNQVLFKITKNNFCVQDFHTLYLMLVIVITLCNTLKMSAHGIV